MSLCLANKLPPEVLSYIFLLGVEQIEYELEMAESEPEDDEEEPPQDIVPFNLLVSQVCRRWRTIAINTATLVSSSLCIHSLLIRGLTHTHSGLI